ncbi:MAG TPA: hypothetical protein VMW16_09200 [Sedimentisphaerales bacterium]|nr:hypothetical protein [Sedimentisphaerales bacterium]
MQIDSAAMNAAKTIERAVLHIVQSQLRQEQSFQRTVRLWISQADSWVDNCATTHVNPLAADIALLDPINLVANLVCFVHIRWRTRRVA